MNLPYLSVLLPTYRQPEILLLTLRDLLAQNYPQQFWELIVVDDGSKDISSEVVLRVLPYDLNVTVKRLPKGGSYSHAQLFNELIRLSGTSTNIFVHVEDVRLKSDFLQQHAKWHLTDELFLVTGPMCESPEETFDPHACSRWELMNMAGEYSQSYQCCFQAIFAKSMSYSKYLVESLVNLDERKKVFDDSMSGWGYHETEFALCAEYLGAKCIYDTQCAVYHPSHEKRDELEYRGVDRSILKSKGTEDNISYLCAKYGLNSLPNWQVGKVIKTPPTIEF